MTFKDHLAQDATAVFLNPAEFAELLLVDGAEVPALWGEQNQSAEDALNATIDAWGNIMESAILNIPEASIPPPVAGQNLNIDGASWKVKKAKAAHGIIRIELERVSS